MNWIALIKALSVSILGLIGVLVVLTLMVILHPWFLLGLAITAFISFLTIGLYYQFK